MKRNRAAYLPAPQRSRLRLPDGARMGVHVIVNVEEWRFDAKLPRTILPGPAGVDVVPDVPNFAWYEYGTRVGIWRIMDVLEKHRAHVTLSLNASVCASYPAIVERSRELGWEIMAHGLQQRAMSIVEDERAVIEQSLDTIERATGTRPRGWLGPGLVQTWATLDLLAEAGLDYCCDWGAADDLPFELEVASGAVLAVPYPIEMNDNVIFALEKQPDATMLERGKRHADRLHRESEAQAKIMGIGLHPHVSGVAHRIDYLDELLAYVAAKPGVRFMSGAEICDWYRASPGV
ncbi:MAG: polysaccharide deacetylase family protein [Candidatus Elarobacter sp.]